MANYSGPLQEVMRALDLVPFLNANPYISLKKLAAEFEVSEKIMANDLMALSMCGLPGYTPYELIDITFDSGYVSIRNHEPLNHTRAFTPTEVSTLLLALGIMREIFEQSSPDFEGATAQLIEKLEALVGAKVAAEPLPYARELELAHRAIATKKSLTLKYLNLSRDEETNRIITPITIDYLDNQYYLSAVCHSSGSERTFRLDRMSSVEIIDSPEPSEARERSQSDETLSSRVALHGRRRRHVENLKLSGIDSDDRATFDFFSFQWAERAILSAAPDVEVLEPVALRSAIKARAEAILATYSH